MALGPTQLPIRAGLLPTELTGMWGWILLRSPHQGRGCALPAAPRQFQPMFRAAQRQCATRHIYDTPKLI